MVFVAGLDRSGTSLLQFLVGALPGYVALGEILSLIGSPQAISRAGTSSCSCGTTIAECSFWGELVPRLKGDGSYAPVLEHFERIYPGQVPVDSSKDASVVLRQVPDSRVLFSIRDVRGWTVSQNRQNLLGFLCWYRGNRRLTAILRDRDHLVVGYSELALRTEQSFHRVAEFLGISDDPPDFRTFGSAEHHAVHVNRMKNQPEKMRTVAYDYRWFRETKWVMPWVLLPFVRSFNNDFVYGHVRDLFESSPEQPVHGSRRVSL
jgi:hypothetical protein